ncbi:phage portal protein [Nocardia transvalensis]|uniref:phage portal protein n=1 Tax=Nocardia transvalensis TaxID=37333 RepID=UPI001895F31F|nr:phage portal protein [Nocardia transvalensis]MBF6328742.1 phage portal protein [Nocardia transvalensis]
MNKAQAVDAVRDILSGPRPFELERLDKIDAAMRPWTAEQALRCLEIRGLTSTQIQGPLAPLAGLARKAQTNFLPLILDTFSQSMKVDNYLSGNGQDTAPPWEWWQRNKFDARQTGVHRTALQYGVSYVTVLPSLRSTDPADGVYLRGVSPRQMTALYGEPLEWDPRGGGPVDDDWPIVAMEMKGPMIRLYDEQNVHFIGVKSVPQSALGWRDAAYLRASNFEYIEGRTHGVGVCPIVRYQDRMLLDGEEVFGIIEPLMVIQERIDETVFEGLVAQYYSAFRQRYVMGWMPKDQAEGLRQAVSDTWFFKDPNVKVGQFEATDLKNYTGAKGDAVRDLAAIGQVPAQNLGIEGISNISEATLAGLEAGKDRKADEIETSLGESHEQMLRACAHIAGDADSAQDFASEVVWRDKTARSYAQTVDALGKLAQMLGIPDEVLWEDIPGWTREKVERAKRARAEQDTLGDEQPPLPGEPPEPRPTQDVPPQE